MFIAEKTYSTSCAFSQECQSTMYCTHSICKCDREDYWSGSVCLESKFKSKRSHESCYIFYSVYDQHCSYSIRSKPRNIHSM